MKNSLILPIINPVIGNGFTGFIFSILSAIISTTAIIIWLDTNSSLENFISGGTAFAINILPIVLSLLGIKLGFLALLVNGYSLFSCKIMSKTSKFYHFFTLIFTIPAGYLLVNLF